jgi:hypothetical protein
VLHSQMRSHGLARCSLDCWGHLAVCERDKRELLLTVVVPGVGNKLGKLLTLLDLSLQLQQ